MPNAFIIGGTGQIGIATAKRLHQEGWNVTLASQSGKGALDFPGKSLDRNTSGALQNALGTGCDLLVDCVAFNADDANTLLEVQSSVSHIVTVSSASVYTDPQGRTLDTAQTLGFPDYPIPIPETHPTIPPGPETYSTNKAAMEQTLLQSAKTPVTILRPCAVHGPMSKHAREWWFVKRLLDGRNQIPLANMGLSRFQTTSSSAIANAIFHAATRPTNPILNIADADAPSVLEIGEVIAAHFGLSPEFLPIETDDPLPGRTPWSLPKPIVCATSLPSKTTYAQSVGPALDWLAKIPLDAWQSHIPQLAAYPRNHFDYELEDNFTV